jgi:hypothetical protein
VSEHIILISIHRKESNTLPVHGTENEQLLSSDAALNPHSRKKFYFAPKAKPHAAFLNEINQFKEASFHTQIKYANIYCPKQILIKDPISESWLVFNHDDATPLEELYAFLSIPSTIPQEEKMIRLFQELSKLLSKAQINLSTDTSTTISIPLHIKNALAFYSSLHDTLYLLPALYGLNSWYWLLDMDLLYFSNSLAALVRSFPPGSPPPSLQGIVQQLYFGLSTTGLTPATGIYTLPDSTLLAYQCHSATVRSYPIAKPSNLSTPNQLHLNSAKFNPLHKRYTFSRSIKEASKTPDEEGSPIPTTLLSWTIPVLEQERHQGSRNDETLSTPRQNHNSITPQILLLKNQSPFFSISAKSLLLTLSDAILESQSPFITPEILLKRFFLSLLSPQTSHLLIENPYMEHEYSCTLHHMKLGTWHWRTTLLQKLFSIVPALPLQTFKHQINQVLYRNHFNISLARLLDRSAVLPESSLLDFLPARLHRLIPAQIPTPWLVEKNTPSRILYRKKQYTLPPSYILYRKLYPYAIFATNRKIVCHYDNHSSDHQEEDPSLSLRLIQLFTSDFSPYQELPNYLLRSTLLKYGIVEESYLERCSLFSFPIHPNQEMELWHLMCLELWISIFLYNQSPRQALESIFPNSES